MKIYSEELKKIKLIDVFEIVLSGEWGEENLEDNENTAYIIRTTNFLNDGTLDVENRELVKRKISREKIDEKHLKRGDIIIEKSGGSPNQPVGRVVYFDIESEKNFLCNNFTSILRVKEGIEPKYIFYFLKDCYKKRIVLKYQNKTTGIINLKLQDYLKNTEIQLPNIEIQKKIVEILDKAFLINSLLIEKERRISELNKCLFIKMFGDPILNEKKFKKGKIRDTIVEAKYGTSKPATIGGKYPYLRMNNITYNGELDLSDLKYITLEKNEEEKYLVEKGDILFNRTNSKELVGKTCVFNLNTPMVIAGYLIKLKVNKQVIPEYISAFLNSVHGKRRLREMCRNIIGQANINAQELQDISILIPPIELQNQFAERVKMIEKSKFLLLNFLKI